MTGFIAKLPSNLMGGDREYVCEDCIEDEFLQGVVRANVISEECDYCGRIEKAPIACSIVDIVEAVRAGIDEYYDDPVNELPWDGREGGYQGTVLDANDVIQDLGLSLQNWDLQEAITSYFDDQAFCEKNYFEMRPVERQIYGWGHFKAVITHKRRFTFWTALDDEDQDGHPDYLPTANMLGEISYVINTARNIRILPEGTGYWRVRIHKEAEQLTAASDLASPPVDKAAYSNRMSPAGVPMFYGAADFDTAVVETYEPRRGRGKLATGARFVTCREMRFLDLASMPPRPSAFDIGRRDLLQSINFLDRFCKDLTRPIQKDGREHIDYVPTQVFTEYVRFELDFDDQKGLDGIIYPSSRNGRECCVIFADHNECLEDVGEYRETEQLLRFDPESLRSERPRDVMARERARR